jgi:hypothetical protein
MQQHYSLAHSSTSMPEALKQAVTLGKHERAHVMQLLDKRKVFNACAGESCCPRPPPMLTPAKRKKR